MCAGLLQLGQLDAKRARKPGRAAKSQPSGLAGLKTTELIARGTAAGFSEESLAAALDTHPPKQALINLSIEGLKDLKTTELLARGAAIGVSEATLEGALDSDAPKKVLVQLIKYFVAGVALPEVPLAEVIGVQHSDQLAKLAKQAVAHELEMHRRQRQSK